MIKNDLKHFWDIEKMSKRYKDELVRCVRKVIKSSIYDDDNDIQEIYV